MKEMRTWIKIRGTIKVSADRVAIDVSHDLVTYYIWHIKKATWNTIPITAPRYGAHITVINPKIHKTNQDLRKVLKVWMNKKVDVYYSLDMFQGGQNKGFVNFWTPVKCDAVERIKNLLNIKESPQYLGEHLTIGSNKNFVQQFGPKKSENTAKNSLATLTKSDKL